MFWMWKPLPLPGEKHKAQTFSRWGGQPHTPHRVLEAPRSRVPYTAANPCPLAWQQLSNQQCPMPTRAEKKPEPSPEQLKGDIWVSAGVQGPEGCLVSCLGDFIGLGLGGFGVFFQYDSILFTIQILTLNVLAWLMTHYEHRWEKNTESCSTTCLLERYHKTGQVGEKSHKM